MHIVKKMVSETVSEHFNSYFSKCSILYIHICMYIYNFCFFFFFYFCDLKTASRVDKAGKAPLIPCDVPLASGPVDNIHLQLSYFGL